MRAASPTPAVLNHRPRIIVLPVSDRLHVPDSAEFRDADNPPWSATSTKSLQEIGAGRSISGPQALRICRRRRLLSEFFGLVEPHLGDLDPRHALRLQVQASDLPGERSDQASRSTPGVSANGGRRDLYQFRTRQWLERGANSVSRRLDLHPGRFAEELESCRSALAGGRKNSYNLLTRGDREKVRLGDGPLDRERGGRVRGKVRSPMPEPPLARRFSKDVRRSPRLSPRRERESRFHQIRGHPRDRNLVVFSPEHHRPSA